MTRDFNHGESDSFALVPRQGSLKLRGVDCSRASLWAIARDTRESTVIQEPRAVAIADYLSCHLRPSVHNNTGPVRGHPVISLYLDTPDFFFFRQAYTGHLNRMKLRIRFYDDEWKRPAFLEVKRRVHEVICKDRAMITREGVRQILTSGLQATHCGRTSTTSYTADDART